MNITKTYFMVPVQDMDRALAFYRDGLGLTLGFSSPGWTELAWRDATIALHLGGAAAEREGWLGFEVDDLDAAVAEIEAAGGRRGTERVEGGVRLITLTDSEGNTLTIGQPGPKGRRRQARRSGGGSHRFGALASGTYKACR